MSEIPSMNPGRTKGFTLIELMFVVVLIGIMIAIAVPSFGSFIANYRATAAVNDVLQAVTLARSEALKQGRRIIILPNDATGNPAVGGSWSNGWTIFADLNNNQTYDAASEAATVISKHAKFATSTTFTAPSGASGIFGTANYILFDGTGYPHTSASGSLGGVKVSDVVGSKTSSPRTLCLAILGRPRISTAAGETCSSA